MEGWKDSTTPIIWLITGIVLLLIFLGFIFLLTRAYIGRIRTEAAEKRNLLIFHQKELLENTVRAEEKEKTRVAQNLHDNLLAQLHRIKLMNTNTEISPLLNESIDQIRQISHDLMPPFLELLSFQEIMLDFLQPFKTKYTIMIHANAEKEEAIQLEKKLQLFRVFQELLVNCEKHASANQINIMWRTTKHYCCLIFQDNGIGMDSNTASGLGLKNIGMRLDILNGVYRFKSEKNQGTKFSVLMKL